MTFVCRRQVPDLRVVPIANDTVSRVRQDMPHGSSADRSRRLNAGEAGREPCHGRTIEGPVFCDLEGAMNRIIYIVGLVVIVIAVLSFFGLR